jgi:hypothetical protein
MAGYGITRQVVFNGSSANSSTVTWGPLWSGDADLISVSIQSVAAVASTWTLEGNNNDGFLTALSALSAPVEWSTVSVIASAGIFSVTPGARWIRVIRPAVNSLSTIIFALRSS